MFISIQDLVNFTGGQLHLASMPPLDGAWVLVPRIVLDSTLVERGDVFWQVEPQDCDTQLAFFRGAVGIVTDGRVVEPWPGTFSLTVENAVDSLDRLVEALEMGRAEEPPSRFLPDQAPAAADVQESLPDSPELKVLQLYHPQGVANFPPTCGQSAKGTFSLRCRRRAA